jgi:hypothetical protein
MVYLKLYLSHIQLFFEVGKERNSSFMPATDSHEMRLRIGNGQCRVFEVFVQWQVSATCLVRCRSNKVDRNNTDSDSAMAVSISAARSG